MNFRRALPGHKANASRNYRDKELVRCFGKVVEGPDGKKVFVCNNDDDDFGNDDDNNDDNFEAETYESTEDPYEYDFE